MSLQVRFHSSARTELTKAVEWYAQRQVGLGKDFSGEVRRALDQIIESPTLFPTASFDVRRCLISRFPYCIVYKVIGSVVWVVAVAHTSRRPEYWINRF
jgi:plasmid stabilization system protein ParE